jgi:hypothetical protein
MNKKSSLKVGRFVKKSVYESKVDMDNTTHNYFLNLGKSVITDEQFINIGFNYALVKGLGEVKKVKSKKK